MDLKPLTEVCEEVKTTYPTVDILGNGSISVPVDQLTEIMQILKNKYGFNFLTNVTAADYLDHMEVVYHLSIIGFPDMLQVKTNIDRQTPVVPSMVPIWGGAIWQEREVYDLLGITFTGHPDLRRIFLDDEWQDHPLRKDFKWEGGRG